MCVKWERMWSCEDNQDVGLEAATIERVRNSSLVEWLCAENVTGLNTPPKLWLEHLTMFWGRGALYEGRRCTVRSAGHHTSENAGISNEKTSENLVRRKPKGS